jgi:hypothetical protein
MFGDDERTPAVELGHAARREAHLEVAMAEALDRGRWVTLAGREVEQVADQLNALGQRLIRAAAHGAIAEIAEDPACALAAAERGQPDVLRLGARGQG